MKTIAILAPCFNEGVILEIFLKELEDTLEVINGKFLITLVDDRSTDNTQQILTNFKFNKDNFQLNIIKLKSNSGHQEAIRQGLQYLNQIKIQIDYIVVMDSDGEDDPRAILEMLALDRHGIIFVQRGKRSEGIVFRIGYFAYKALFKLLTGQKINFGNYSMFNKEVLSSVSDNFFIHFAGYLSKQKTNKFYITYDRRKRIDGKSKMNTNSLVIHGLYSLIEYSEEVVISLIKLFIIFLITILIMITYVIYTKFIIHTAIPGWASALTSSLITICLIILSTIMLTLIGLSIKKTVNQKKNFYEEIR